MRIATVTGRVRFLPRNFAGPSTARPSGRFRLQFGATLAADVAHVNERGKRQERILGIN